MRERGFRVVSMSPAELRSLRVQCAAGNVFAWVSQRGNDIDFESNANGSRQSRNDRPHMRLAERVAYVGMERMTPELVWRLDGLDGSGRST